jgi:dTDP-4-amino-4,6-dideoxygalactose transaminase
VLPPLDEYLGLLRRMWDTRVLTNMGPMHQRLEQAINDRVGIGVTSLWSNGMTALLGAVRVLGVNGRAIVTPFTFPATVHALSLLGIEPIFADIDDETLTLDPSSVAERIEPDVTAIVGTHVYGAMCRTEELGTIARDNRLKVLFDGAHSFARELPIFPGGARDLGDITMLSFHATKLFHSAEGGALITADAELDRRIRLARNFGIKNEDEVESVGFNGKMSELHAAMGVAMLGLLDDEIARRRAVAAIYVEELTGIPGVRIVAGAGEAVQYFVVRIDPAAFGSDRDALHQTLRSANVISRRYFFPLCSDLPPYSHVPSARQVPVAQRAAAEVLAIPLHSGVSAGDARHIAELIRWQQGGGAR